MQERMRGERRSRAEQQDVVVMGADEGVDGDEAVAARAVFHDNRLAPFRGELLSDQPRRRCRPRNRAERQHEFHRTLRPGLGRRGLRRGG